MPVDRTQIESLHALYVTSTGLDVFLDAERERTWFEWCRYRPDDPFTAGDLVLVILHLKRGIKAEKRNRGALRFRNLIGAFDSFDEERAEARSLATAAARMPKVNEPRASALNALGRDGTHLDNTGKAGTPPPDATLTAGEASAKALEGLRNFKETLK